MKLGLALGFCAFTLLVVLFVWLRARVEFATVRLARAQQDALDLDLDTRTHP
jgi:hypothetical protein